MLYMSSSEEASTQRKEQFEIIESQKGKAIFNSMTSHCEIYLYGMLAENKIFGRDITGSARRGMRAIGMLLESQYEMTALDINNTADELENIIVPYEGIFAPASWAKARLAEGIFDAGNLELSNQLVETGMHPAHIDEVTHLL
jgi:hypothetical protein